MCRDIKIDRSLQPTAAFLILRHYGNTDTEKQLEHGRFKLQYVPARQTSCWCTHLRLVGSAQDRLGCKMLRPIGEYVPLIRRPMGYYSHGRGGAYPCSTIPGWPPRMLIERIFTSA